MTFPDTIGKDAKYMILYWHSQIKNIEICDWIMAKFSTTTNVDRTIFAIQMMATMKK